MALDGLRASATFGLCLALCGCDTRGVYLVPSQDPLTGSGGATEHDASPPPGNGGSIMFPGDASGRGDARAQCETQRYAEQPQPLGVYMMVDQSRSMKGQWDSVSQALDEFIGQGDTLGKVSVGIQYYALTASDVPLLTNVCVPDIYQKPGVAIAPLPVNAQPLYDSIRAHGPTFLEMLGLVLDTSPTDAALTGAITGASNWAAANASSHPKPVVVLVTDGIPSTDSPPVCTPSIAAAVAAATQGLAADPPVSTYVLDVGPPSADLDSIAAAGGTDHAYAAANAGDMLVALQNIRKVALPCDVTVSVAAATALAENRLNVELHSSTGATRLGRVGTLDSGASGISGCNADRTNEWYGEGSGDGAAIRLCPNTCVYVRTVTGASLDVVLGCKTTTID